GAEALQERSAGLRAVAAPKLVCPGARIIHIHNPIAGRPEIVSLIRRIERDLRELDCAGRGAITAPERTVRDDEYIAPGGLDLRLKRTRRCKCFYRHRTIGRSIALPKGKGAALAQGLEKEKCAVGIDERTWFIEGVAEIRADREGTGRRTVRDPQTIVIDIMRTFGVEGVFTSKIDHSGRNMRSEAYRCAVGRRRRSPQRRFIAAAN